MRERWGLRRRWRLYVGCLAALVGLTSTVLVVAHGHPRRDVLVAEEPTPTPTATASAVETPEPSATASPGEAPPATGAPTPEGTDLPTPSPSPEQPGLHLDADHLLSNGYVSTAFGAGRRPFVGTDAFGAAVACTAMGAGMTPSVDVDVARIWSWTGEVVVGETFARAPTAEEASDALRTCRSPDHSWGQTGRQLDLDLGDESFLWRADASLSDEAMAGVRVGRALIFVVWRQTGGLASTEVLARAARDALALVRDEHAGAPVVAEHRAASSALAGFLSYDALRPLIQPDAGQWNAMSWMSDDDRPFALQCAGAEETWMHPQGPMVTRRFLGGFLTAGDYFSVALTLAEDSDPVTAAGRFDECRRVSHGTPVADLGDEAFEAGPHLTVGGSSYTTFVRVGSRHVVLYAYSMGHSVEMARAAVASLEAAGRFA